MELKKKAKPFTAEQKSKIAELRREGWGYAPIAVALGTNTDHVMRFCQRNNLGGRANANNYGIDTVICPNCGRVIVKNEKGRTARFCSNECKSKYWYAKRKGASG